MVRCAQQRALVYIDYRTTHVPRCALELDGADARDLDRYNSTRLVRFVRKNQIYAT